MTPRSLELPDSLVAPATTRLRPRRLLLGAPAYFFHLARLLYKSATSSFWERGRGRRLVRKIFFQQVYFTAVEALPVILLVAIAFGALLMIQASNTLPRYGMREVEWITAFVLFRELGPLIVALVVIARSANAMVIEIGNMRVNGEIRALEIMGINLDRLIVLPRVAAMVISLIVLTVAFCAAAFWGGYGLARLSGLLASDFVYERLAAGLPPSLLANILLRALCFGLLIASVSCHHGLRVSVAPTEVPQQASRGVINALVLCFLANFVISVGVNPG